MAPFEALYGRRCRSPIGWFKIGKEYLIGPDLMHQAMEKVKIIKERLKTAQSGQKSYSDVRRRDLEFKENDWVFLKISPMKDVMRSGKKGKLSLRTMRTSRRTIGGSQPFFPSARLLVNADSGFLYIFFAFKIDHFSFFQVVLFLTL
ncbi:uncharacterized protein [Nicotiana tomentosiformis]|uniref:uncharacterized protein n=1 Tax=Nicotiana tomentosiformis TaxID=4098 RepID=UPI00388C8790